LETKPAKSTKSSSTKTEPLRAKSLGPRTPSSDARILEWIDENFELIVYPDGYEDCIVGVGEHFGGPPVAVLDVEKMLSKMQKKGRTREEAIKYFEFNILGAHVGEQNPVYLHVPNFKATKPSSKPKGAKAT
jgi:hypothetical protein